MEELTPDSLIRWGEVYSKKEAMQLAIELAGFGVGFVSPNPPVGCVIIDLNQRLIGAGWHKQFGGPHAEVNAIQSVKDKSLLNGATVYVTLEPCNHVGKTPPCTDLLLSLPVKSLVYAFDDPNPKVSSKGLTRIKKAGITVEKYAFLEDENEPLVNLKKWCAPFFHNQKNKSTFISVKVASSLDGGYALSSGESQWITNEKSRQHAHYIRGLHDAIIVGQNTVAVDDPSLNIRFSKFKGKSIKLVVLDPELSLLKQGGDLNIFKAHSRDKIFWVCKPGVDAAPFGNENVIECGFDAAKGGFDLSQLSDVLYSKYAIGCAMVEGGALTYGEFINQKLAQRLYLFMGAKLLGSHLKTWTNGVRVSTLSEAIVLNDLKLYPLGSDFMIEAQF